METRRWTNPSQPQTLYIAVFLLYINAAFNVLFGSIFGVIGLITTVGEVAAGFGIANDKKWGYWLGVVMAGLQLVPFVLYIFSHGVGSIFNPSLLLSALFPVVLFALLVHPMSREYQKVWFN